MLHVVLFFQNELMIYVMMYEASTVSDIIFKMSLIYFRKSSPHHVGLIDMPPALTFFTSNNKQFVCKNRTSILYWRSSTLLSTIVIRPERCFPIVSRSVLEAPWILS